MQGNTVPGQTSAPAARPSRFVAALRAARDPALLLLILATVVVGCGMVYRLEAGRIATQQAQREVVRVSLLTQLLLSELRPVADDLRLLADSDALRTYLATGSDASRLVALRRARFFSESKPSYDQIRFIDASGTELLRVNEGGVVVAQAQLQNKADRRYFQQANALAPGSLFMSSIDLNFENGRVQEPAKPVLRMAVPVFDANGQRRGIYIINYLVQNVIGRLESAAASTGHRLRMLNADGYWLKAADPAQEWGFAMMDRAAFNLARSDAPLWSAVQSQRAGQRLTRDGLVTWQQVTPAEFAGLIAGRLVADEAFLVVATEVSGVDWTALFADLRRIVLLVASGLALLAALSFWLYLGRRRVLLQLRGTNQQLELRVAERTGELQDSYQLLQHREQLLEEMGHLAKVGGWDFDPVTGAGRWTAEVARIHDLDATLAPSRELGLDFYPGESRTRLEAALRQSMTDGTPYDLELEFISARGEHKWVRTISHPLLEHGKVVRVRGALQDITERKQADLRLQAQLQRLHLLERTTRAISERHDLASILQVVIRTLEEQMPLDFGCICLYDPADRSLTVTAVGIASTVLAGQMSMPEEARIPIDANGLSHCLHGQLVYEPDIGTTDFPFPQRLFAGGLRAMVAAPLQVESTVFGVLIAARGKTNSFSSSDCEFLRQISEHVALAARQAQLHGALQAAYEDLRASQQAVMQQDRLRVLGQMASGIAHDINNAISPITLYADSLLDTEPGLSKRARGNLRTIQQAAADVAATVARLREFYRHRDRQSEHGPVDLNLLMTQMRELTRARWESMPQRSGIVIDLQLALGAEVPAVHGVESEIREALTNLIFNAVDAMPTGGTLQLRTGVAADGAIHAEVVDSGAGMNAETVGRCLEPFFTTKGERGTGLGLAMVYGVMQRHGGDIRIQSEPGVGTTVRLSFCAAVGMATPVVAAQYATRELAVLLVDDDPVLLNSLRETLELDGHTIVTASGGQRGIDAFRASLQPDEVRIDIVITDLGMPHVDGRRVAAEVKRASPDTPVVLLTGWGERLLAEGQLPPHVDRVLSKPPRLRDLRRLLAELAPVAAAVPIP